MSQQPYSEELWTYPTSQDYGLGDIDTGSSDIPVFMMRMMLSIKDTSPGDDYAKYKYSFKKAAKYYYQKGFINLMNGKIEIVGNGIRYEIESRKKTHNAGESNVTDAPEKVRRFEYWVMTATRIRNGQEAV